MLLVSISLAKLFCEKFIHHTEQRMVQLKQNHLQDAQLLIDLVSARHRLSSLEEDLTKRYGFDNDTKHDIDESLHRQIVSMELRMEEITTKLNVSLEALQSQINECTAKLQLIRKAMELTQEHMNDFADGIFDTPSFMLQEIEIMNAMCQSTKYVVQNYVTESSIQDEDANIIPLEDLIRMKVIDRLNEPSTCSSCHLPILCNIKGKCVFCLSDLPQIPLVQESRAQIPLVQESRAQIPLVQESQVQESSTEIRAFTNVVPSSDKSNGNSISKTNSESIVENNTMIDDCGGNCVQSHAISTATATSSYTIPDISDPRIGVKISREVCQRMAEGWILEVNMHCTKCGTQMMCDGKDPSTSLCLLCDVILRDTSDK